MHKIHKTAIFILLVVLTPTLVSACGACNDSKKEQPSTYDSAPNQPAGTNDEGNKDKGNKKDTQLPPAEGNTSQIADESSKKKEANNQEKELKEKELKEKQRNIKQEIITTEESYNKSLHLLKDLLLEPLKERFKDNKEIQKFTNDLLQAIDPLIIISDSLQEDFKAKVVSSEVTNKDLGEIFQKHIPFFVHFSKFSALYADILTRFTTLSEKNKTFGAFLDELEKRPELNLLRLSDYIIMPIQRFPRYKLLIQDLLKNMPQEDAGYKAIQEDLDKISASLDSTNASVPQMPPGKRPRGFSLSGPSHPKSAFKKKSGTQ